jgi:hypothetical protein
VPDALVAAIPPSEASAPGSTGKNSPCERNSAFSRTRRTPACTRQSNAAGDTSRMASIRDRSTQMPPWIAATCPSTEVPAPNGTIGTLASRHSATMAATSSVLWGNATPSGRPATGTPSPWL